jgi:hypothetical protein
MSGTPIAQQLRGSIDRLDYMKEKTSTQQSKESPYSRDSLLNG